MRRHSRCSREKPVKLRLPDHVLIDVRLAVKDDHGAADAAGSILARYHIEWIAGKARRMDDIQGGEYITGDLAIAINGNGRRLALFWTKFLGARPDSGHDLVR